jgi:hypothetical protein
VLSGRSESAMRILIIEDEKKMAVVLKKGPRQRQKRVNWT